MGKPGSTPESVCVRAHTRDRETVCNYIGKIQTESARADGRVCVCVMTSGDIHDGEST